MSALRPLLSGIVDYAGLFPPAALDMPDAVREYAAYRHDRDAWMLGRFVVPVARLASFENELSVLDPFQDDPWPVSALAGADLAADLVATDAFNARQAGRAQVDTIEARLAEPGSIASAAALVGGRFAFFVEIPVDHDVTSLVAAIGSSGLQAKIRTGGVTPEAFPLAKDILRFMRACASAGVPFKATAGLHHPIRAEHRLTYAPNAPRGTMYGYLNVFLTAALLNELSDADALALLDERDAQAFTIDRDGIGWRGHELRPDQAHVVRERVAVSFGSCSFREPVDDLRALSFLS